MAFTAHALNARRAETLLRCQKVREQRRRREVSRADFASAQAAEAERSAWNAAETGKVAAAERLRRAYGDLAGRTVGVNDLAALPALERALAQEAEERAGQLASAREAAMVAREAVAVAREALLAESRATEKRSKLAEHTRKTWRRAAEAAEEQESDEQVADTWRPT